MPTILKVEFENNYYILNHKDVQGEGIMKTKSFERVQSYIELLLSNHAMIQAWDCLTVEGGFE